MSAEQRIIPTITTLLTSPDCLHPELPLTDKTEQSYLTQLATALAKGELDDAAYGQCLTRLEAGNLSVAALYRFANFCYQYWLQQWPAAEALQAQQAEIARQAAQLQTGAQGRTLFRRPGTPTRYYWGQTHSQAEGAVEKGLFFACYPAFAAHGEGVNAIHHAELITDASQLIVCEAYTQAQRREQAFSQLLQRSSLLHQRLQSHGHHAQIIVNLQLAWLYYRSGRVVNSLSIHEVGQAVFYFRQAMGQIARQAFTQQQPPLPAALTTTAEQLQALIDQTLLDQVQQTLFTAQSSALVERWQLCYQEPQLEAVYQLSQQTQALLTQAASVPPAAKQPLLDAWFAGFNRGLAEEDEQEVRVAMQSAVTRACNPVQKYPHSLATVHQWLLTLARQLQQHNESGRARALLHAYQQLLIRRRPNLQQTIASTDQDKAPYLTILATCKQALTELDQWLTDTNIVAESKTSALNTTPASNFAKRNEQVHIWRQTLAQSLTANTKASDIYTANTQFARNLLADICREIEQQISSAPCAYTLLGAGSFSRGEISPASDVDCALLVAEDTAKTHPWFRCFLQLLQWKLASLPAGVLSLESETLAWISKGYWFDTPAGFIEQHLASQQPNDPSSLQQPENFGAQWFRWIYSSGNQPQEKDMLFADYQKRLQTFFHTPLSISSLPAYQQLAPWSLNQHIGQAITPSRRQLSLSADTRVKETKESKPQIQGSSNPTAATNTFTVLNIKHLSYRLINAILCYGRFYDVPPGITTTREVLAYLKDHRCLPSAFTARLETALDQLYTWRLRQHWAWLHHASELGENEVVLWPEDLAQQTVIAALPEGWRGFYLDKTETEQCWAIAHHTVEVIGRSGEGFATYASRIPAVQDREVQTASTATVEASGKAEEKIEAPKTKHELGDSALLSSSFTTVVPDPKETKESKREVSEAEAQVIIAAQSRIVTEIKSPAAPSTNHLFNPLATAVEWTLQQLTKPKNDKASEKADYASRAAHVQWLAQAIGKYVEELPIAEFHNNGTASIKQNSLFRSHWRVYWAIPTAWRDLYIKQLKQSLAICPDNIIELLVNAPNHVGWRLAAKTSEQQWQRAFQSLFAWGPQTTLPPGAKAKIAQGQAVWVSWIDQGAIYWAPLQQQYADTLIDSKAQQWRHKHNASGNHRLYQLQTPQGCFWLKLYPEQPGTEYLVNALDSRLGINGTPPHQLFALHHAPLRVPDGTPQGMLIEQSAALLVPHIADSKQNLHYISKQHPEQLGQLDFIVFAKTLLRVLLTNPEDDKGDDYFLLPTRDNDKRQLIRIDNERAFLPITHVTSNKRGQKELQVKSILYCLDQMLLPWSSDLRIAVLLDDLYQLQPSALIMDLLQDVEQQQRCWQQLFPETVVAQHACLQDPWMSLPVFLLPQGLESALLKRLTSLQTALRLLKPQAITGLKLLEIVQPKLAQYYNLSLFQGKLAPNPQHPQANVWARFEKVAGCYYQQRSSRAALVSAADTLTSIQSGPAVYSRQLSLALPELPKTIEERSALTVFAQSVWSQQAHSIKQALEAVEDWQYVQFEEVRKGLLAKRADPKETVRIREKARVQFRLLSGREQQLLLEQLLISKTTTNIPLEQQRFLLAVLVGAECHNLDFRSFKAVLTNDLLRPILREAGKQIIALDLSGCNLLTPDILKEIEQHCPYLKRLRLNDQPHWKTLSVGNFIELTTLECNNAAALKGVKFGHLPALHRLSLKATPLEEIANKGWGITKTAVPWTLPNLKHLDTTGSNALRDVRIDTQEELVWVKEGNLLENVQGKSKILKGKIEDLPSTGSSPKINFGKFFSGFRTSTEPQSQPKILEEKHLSPPPKKLKITLHLYQYEACDYFLSYQSGYHHVGTFFGTSFMKKTIQVGEETMVLETFVVGAGAYEAFARGGMFKMYARGSKAIVTFLHIEEDKEKTIYHNFIYLMRALEDLILFEEGVSEMPVIMIGVRNPSTASCYADLSSLAQDRGIAKYFECTLDNLGVTIDEALLEAVAEGLKLKQTPLKLQWVKEPKIKFEGDFKPTALPTTKASSLSPLFKLWDNVIGQAGAQKIVTALQSGRPLAELDFTCLNLGDVGTQALANALEAKPFIKSLNVNNNYIGTEGAQALAKIITFAPTLASLSARHNNLRRIGAEALAGALQTRPSLISLNIAFNKIEDAGAQALAEALKIHTNFRYLDVEYNNINHAGTQALAEGLQSSRRLISLNLGGNKFSEAGIKSLAKVFEAGTVLASLSLHNTELGEVGTQILVEALKTNTTLKLLNLVANRIGDAGAQAIAELLKAKLPILSLDIADNNIGDPGAQALAEALKVNKTLKFLNMRSNKISDAGAQALAEALKANQVLNLLNIGRNWHVGDLGAQALAGALKVNTALKFLNMEYNNIKDAGAQALAEALKRNSSLIALNLEGNSVQDLGGKAFVDALKHNITLIQLNTFGGNKISSQISDKLPRKFISWPSPADINVFSEDLSSPSDYTPNESKKKPLQKASLPLDAVVLTKLASGKDSTSKTELKASSSHVSSSGSVPRSTSKPSFAHGLNGASSSALLNSNAQFFLPVSTSLTTSTPQEIPSENKEQNLLRLKLLKKIRELFNKIYPYPPSSPEQHVNYEAYLHQLEELEKSSISQSSIEIDKLHGLYKKLEDMEKHNTATISASLK